MASIQGPRPATLDEAAEFFRVSKSTVERLVRDGVVPTYGGFTRTTRVDLVEMDSILKGLRKTGKKLRKAAESAADHAISEAKRELKKAQSEGNPITIARAQDALQLAKAKAALFEGKAAINPTEADGSSQIDGYTYGSDEKGSARVIPGTKTVQSPVEDAPEGDEDAMELAERLKAEQKRQAKLTKSLLAAGRPAAPAVVTKSAAPSDARTDALARVRAVTEGQAAARRKGTR